MLGTGDLFKGEDSKCLLLTFQISVLDKSNSGQLQDLGPVAGFTTNMIDGPPITTGKFSAPCVAPIAIGGVSTPK